VDKEFDLDRVSSTKFVNSQHQPTCFGVSFLALQYLLVKQFIPSSLIGLLIRWQVFCPSNIDRKLSSEFSIFKICCLDSSNLICNKFASFPIPPIVGIQAIYFVLFDRILSFEYRSNFVSFVRISDLKTCCLNWIHLIWSQSACLELIVLFFNISLIVLNQSIYSV